MGGGRVQLSSGGTRFAAEGFNYVKMPMNLVAPVFRLAAPVLAALQMAVFTGAPVYEALTMARQIAASASVTSPDSEQRVPAHDARTCPACQTLRTTAWLTEPPRLELPTAEVTTPGTVVIDDAPALASRPGFLSRAPPQLLG